jgi:predicted DNA-binding transcriptional regulator AlpA
MGGLFVSQSTGFTAANERTSRAGGRRLLSFKQLRTDKGIPFSKVWIWRLIQAGKFPRPIKFSAGGHNCWFEHEVDEYLENLRRARDEEPED